jgi:hypothetical protein
LLLFEAIITHPFYHASSNSVINILTDCDI